MKRMLFNATQSEELRVAIVDGQKLIDLDIEHAGKEQRKSNIYKGVITRIEPSLEAAFVDYGSERHGFLPFKEISRSYFQDTKKEKGGRPKIQEVIKEGQEVIVQVDKDERGSKGAALTTFISLAGRYLVLMPNNPRGGGVSRRVEGEERNELREIMAQLNTEKGMSIIARTAGIGRTAEELQWDLNYLTQLWKAIEDAAQLQPGAYLIYQEGSLVIRAIRDYFSADIGEILIDTPDVHEQAIQFMDHVMPSNVSRVKLYEDETPLFSRFQIENQIESAFSREVRLPSGGAIVIDHTEALVSIDVNSGRSIKGADIEQTAFNTNIEAAEEVARQMRLRDLGGLVVIDFIDMEVSKHQREVENAIKDALHYDRARVQTSKISRFGLMELSRQRLRPSIGESNHGTCPRCNGTGHIRGIESTALHILRITQEEAMKEQSAIIQVQLPVDAATFLLNEKRADIHQVEERTGVEVVLVPNMHMETPNYSISRIKHDDLNEEITQASYKMVDKPVETEYVQKMNEAPPVKPEAVVKGVTTATSAPLVNKPVADKPIERVSIFGKVKAWFGLTPEEKKEAEPEKKETKPRNNNNKRNNQNRNQRNRNRNRNHDKTDRKQTESKQAQDKNHQHKDKQVQQGNKPSSDENKETRQDRGPRRNRRNRRDRRPRDEQATEQSVEQTTQQNNAEPKAENVTTEANATKAPAKNPAAEKASKPAAETEVSKTVDTNVATDSAEAKPASPKKTRAPRKAAAKKKAPEKKSAVEADAIDLVETKPTTEASPKSDTAKKPAAKKKPAARKPRATKAASIPAAEPDAGLELVETKATKPQATKAAPKKTTKAKTTKKEANWKKTKDDAGDSGDALVMVETQKKD